MEITEEIAEQYMKASNWTIKENDGRIEGDFDSPDGQRRGIMFQPFNGISVALFDFNAKSIPSGPTSSDCGYSCQFNYCICGRIECVLDDNSYFYMTENELSVTCQNPGDEFFFPTNRYQGIDIFFNTDALAETQDPVLRSFELDFSKIPVLYFGKRNTFTAEANSKLKAVMEKLWSLYDDFSPFYARLYTLEFLHLFLSDKACIERHCTFYTRTQIEIAKKAEQLLTADLSKHIPARELAERFSVSETSLKNYFRNVFGQNISKYMRTLRMNKAAELLAETTLPVSEISIQSGYLKQGKFAAVFKAHTGMAPLEYRRSKKIESYQK